jgi:hypothetical protein
MTQEKELIYKMFTLQKIFWLLKEKLKQKFPENNKLLIYENFHKPCLTERFEMYISLKEYLLSRIYVHVKE